MDKEPKQTTDNDVKKNKKLNNTIHVDKNESEFADELTSSDINSAFKNPITGEERLY